MPPRLQLQVPSLRLHMVMYVPKQSAASAADSRHLVSQKGKLNVSLVFSKTTVAWKSTAKSYQTGTALIGAPLLTCSSAAAGCRTAPKAGAGVAAPGVPAHKQRGSDLLFRLTPPDTEMNGAPLSSQRRRPRPRCRRRRCRCPCGWSASSSRTRRRRSWRPGRRRTAAQWHCASSGCSTTGWVTKVLLRWRRCSPLAACARCAARLWPCPLL